MDILSKLNKGLKFGAGAASGTLIHDNESAILDAATQLLSKSATGAKLLNFAAENGIKMHVLRNKAEIAYNPAESTVYIAAPAGLPMPGMRAVIHLAGALRQAQQETMEGLERPKSANIPQDQYVKTFVQKDKDALFAQTCVVYELSKVNGLSEIVDEYEAMGYLSLYKAYQEDMKSQGIE
jgi:predicted transcriptional regulator